MIVTFNEKEIRNMILDGLRKMGIDPGEAKVTMIAGRSPNGMTAEVALTVVTAPVISVEAIPRETFSGTNKASILETTSEEYGGSNPDGVDAMKAEAENGDDGDGALAGADEIKPTETLFEK